MKITLVVLFLAGLTIYCKCTPVLSLPPSLIAHAASLEERLKTQKPTTTKLTETRTDNGSDVVAAAAAEQLEAQQNDEEELQDANNVAEDFYKNLKNLWQKDLSLNLQKRERQTFEDDIVNSATQQQQQQPLTTIKNNNKIALEQNVPKQQQQQHNANNNNNNIFKTTSSAATSNEATNLNIDPQHDQQQLVSEEYDCNEWLPPITADLTNDEMIQTLLPPRPAATNVESTPSQLQDVADAVVWNKYLKPLKYWTRQCQSENENENCPQEYYRTLIADRNNALIKQLQYKQNLQNLLTPTTPATSLNMNPFYSSKDSEISSNLPLDYNRINNDDITLLLTAEQNLIQFLSWALAELYPFGKFENQSVDGADFYHPGMYMWKKLNLSGRLEPPLLVDEPRYVIVRREYGQNNYDDDYKRGLNYGGDPFIPPRGRKHNLPDLDSLLHRYETFVPNRGRRDKIRDIFKYDDLFYPNRGKRQMTMAPIDIGDGGVVADERSDNDVDDDEDQEEENQLNNYEENFEQQLQQYPLSANEMTTMEHIKNLMAKMKRKLHQNHRHEEGQQKIENSFDEMSRNEPTKMSTTFQLQQLLPPSLLSKRFKSMFNILHKQQRRQQQHSTTANPRRQWLKRYTTTATTTNNDRPATVRSRTMATNRLQTLRSMSPLQQLTQLYQQHHPEQQQQHQENQHLQQHHHHHLQQPDYISSPSLWKPTTKFMWQPPKQLQQQLQQQQLQHLPLKSLAQQFDPLSWHKLQMLQHQYQHQPLLTMRHPRLTALQHLPSIQQQQHQQQQHQQHRQLATPQETQLTYSSDQIDNSITNDLQNFFNKDLD